MAEIKPMIHKYCQNGTYMLLDVNSGIINVIDKMTYDVLDVYDGTNKDAVYQAFPGLMIKRIWMKPWKNWTGLSKRKCSLRR